MEHSGKVHKVRLEDRDILNIKKGLDEEKIFGRGLMENEYCVLFDRYDTLIGVYKKKGEGLVPIDERAKYGLFNKLGATKGNYEQMCVIDALLDDSIDLVVVTGNAGTGKSYIVLLTGMYMVEYLGKNLLYTREIVPVGKSIGYLPGGEDDKTAPYWKPAKINLIKIQNARGKFILDTKGLEQSGKISFTPLQFLRGTTIDNTLMFNDEAQNEDLDTVQMFATRIGEGSKVVFAGSTKQIDDKNLRNGNDGLSLLIKIMKGEKNFAHIHLVKQERHRLAQQIDERIELYKEGRLWGK